MVIVFGSINLDLAFDLDAIPAPGETRLCPALRTGPGGKGANQALAARRDGAAVALAGAVGQDAFAGPALALLSAAGVDLSRVARRDAGTGCAAVLTDPAGRNAIAVAAGANLLARADQVEDALLRPGATLLLQMECDPTETAALIRRAHARGARVLLNLAPAAPLPADALALLDLLIVNEPEAAWLDAPDAAALHRRLGVGVVRTLGGAGAEYAVRGAAGLVAAVPVRVVDSTGAGDCFAGVLAAALDRGAALPDAMRRACAAAALACTRTGAQAALPDAADTDALLASPSPSGVKP